MEGIGGHGWRSGQRRRGVASGRHNLRAKLPQYSIPLRLWRALTTRAESLGEVSYPSGAAVAEAKTEATSATNCITRVFIPKFWLGGGLGLDEVENSMRCFPDDIKQREHNTKQVSVDFIKPRTFLFSLWIEVYARYKAPKLIASTKGATHDHHVRRSPYAHKT